MYTESEIKSLVNKALTSMVTRNTPVELYEPILYSISVGGKHIRPILCLLCYNLYKETINNNVIMPAVGIEIFHGFTLIHDDIMDNAEVRRGNTTVHKKWSKNTAILSGDAMCIEAYRFMTQTTANYLPQVLEIFNKTAAQVCEGQQYDMMFEEKFLISEQDYLTMIGLKTASLIAAAAKIGAIVAESSITDSQKLYQFGYNLGMAFQIQDDVLDTYGNFNLFGKSIGGDIVSNKKTFLLVSALIRAQGKKMNALEELLKTNNISDEEKIDKVKTIFDELEIKSLAEAKVNHYFNTAMEYLKKIDITEHRKENIVNFVTELIDRNY
ncbi:MAG: polyprenyl synthetase family protein [Prevotellaceae bacterium]|jgi:geranylgeranyl diphosphate synthase type II|nr:polyprenyl synthetase family protein [Prevotellaceae bacterium]